MSNNNNTLGCKKKEETPKPTGVVVNEIQGIKYFKLQSKIPGDYTKNCGLLGNEIDENFYFLRSNDIKTGYTEIVENRKYLVLVRVNDDMDPIRIDITDDDIYDHDFYVDDGYIYVKYPGSEEYVPFKDKETGEPVRFLVEGQNVRVATDASIMGDGTCEKPLSIDLAYRTGTYEPAQYFIDLTCPEATLKLIESGIGYGDAVVSKESASRFGRLYTFKEAKKINAALSGDKCGWRLPSKEDWAELLNWAEGCDGNKNHDTDKSGNFGKIAGTNLKSIEFWDGLANSDEFGFSIYPVGLCPEVYNTKEPEDYGFTGLYKTASYWSNSEKDGEVYVRTFSYGHDDVAQYTESPARRLSIRLVRDVTNDFDIPEYEYILGNYVPVVLTTDGKQLWTKYNIDFTDYEDADVNSTLVPDDWKDVDTEVKAVVYYKLVENEGVYMYDTETPLDRFDLPSTVDPDMPTIKEDEIPQNPTADDPEYIAVEYIIHLDMVDEAKFYYNAWDGKRWHKKMMKEGESVVLLKEDYPNPCDSAATPYVTNDNKNHEWRVYVNEQTGLDELIDTVEAMKHEIEHDMSGDMASLQEEIDRIEASVGLDEDGNYIAPVCGLTSASTSIMDAIQILDQIIIDNEETTAAALNDLNDRLSVVETKIDEISGDFDDLNERLNQEISARTEADEAFQDALDEETSARTAADEALQEQIDELASKSLEAENKSIVLTQDGNKTLIRVGIEDDDEHLKLGENGLFFDGDFGEYGQEEQDNG